MALYTEVFPTRARGTGAGFASSMYWGGGIFWVALASVLSTFYGWQFTYIIIAPVANVLCPIAMACLKRIPPGKALEQLHI
jgi:MFS family permease